MLTNFSTTVVLSLQNHAHFLFNIKSYTIFLSRLKNISYNYTFNYFWILEIIEP
jgi:hypothetical protein